MWYPILRVNLKQSFVILAHCGLYFIRWFGLGATVHPEYFEKLLRATCAYNTLHI